MRVHLEYVLPSGQILRIGEGDITQETTAAIVNAANERLEHGGGVAGAIRRQGGEAIQEESRRWVREHGLVRTGRAAITGAGSLAAEFVIHAVGPIWGTGDEEEKLASAVRSALQLAEEHKISSISLPAISAGIFGFPAERCARILLETIAAFLHEHPQGNVRQVHVCLYGAEMTAIFLEEARRQYE